MDSQTILEMDSDSGSFEMSSDEDLPKKKPIVDDSQGPTTINGEPTDWDGHGASKAALALPPAKRHKTAEGFQEFQLDLNQLMLEDAMGRGTGGLGSQKRVPNKPYVKWAITTKGDLPFVLNQETNMIQCGFVKMTMKTDPHTDRRHITCLSGCGPQCQEHTHKKCECYCHYLQKDYDSRHW